MPLNVQCKRCANLKNHWCNLVKDSPDEDMVRDCRHYRTFTNVDRVRAMSDEELASLFNRIETEGRGFGPRGKAAWLDWLRQEAT